MANKDISLLQLWGQPSDAICYQCGHAVKVEIEFFIQVIPLMVMFMVIIVTVVNI